MPAPQVEYRTDPSQYRHIKLSFDGATAQLAIMVDTGITLSAALSGIADTEDNPTFRAPLCDLKNRVEGGEDFSSALANHPRYFDKTFISMVKASEHTGTLGEMLERIAGYLRSELETRAKVRAALAGRSDILERT